MTYLPGLVLALAAFWFALSGQTSPFFIGLGVVSVLLTLWLAARLRIMGRDASPYHRLPQMLVYLPWLIVEVVKANVAVIARVLGPRHTIDPAVVRMRTSARTDLGRALFANSITLTPGTVTIGVEGDKVMVHALVRDKASVASFEPMDRRVAAAADPARRKG
ncbi:MAG: Na+/H+ antiporter subunit E [Hyphomonadaceae bacterium]